MAYVRMKTGGGGSAPVLITKNITQNGTYNASADSADGYSQVTVAVSGGGATLGEKTISTYGVYNASADSLDGYSKVTNITGLETATASGSVASISDAVEMPCPSVVADIDYTAQGVTGATVSRRKKNFWNTNLIQSCTNRPGDLTNNGDGTITVDADRQTNVKSLQKLKDICPNLKIGQAFTLTATTTGTAQYIYLHEVQFVWYFDGRAASTQTITKEMANSYVSFYASGVNTSATISNIMLRLPSENSDYEAYNGTDYTATFGRTIYGGSYDFVSGVLTEDTDANGDPISPPNTYTLTPQQIDTLQGVNNFYSDTGDTAVQYYREKQPELERLFYFEGVQSDSVQIPPATTLDEGDSFDEYLSYDTTTKKFTVLKAFSAVLTGWVRAYSSGSTRPTGGIYINDALYVGYQTASSTVGDKAGYSVMVNFVIGDNFYPYQTSSNGYPQQFLKAYLLKNVDISGVIELDDETA